jgi:uncharacterized membrane protein YoaT (DUF817 family)
MQSFFSEFFVFGLKQAWACLFGGILLFFMILTHYYYPWETLARYDFLFLVAVLTQVLLLVFRLESSVEARVIFLFHVVGTVMEIFKTSDFIGAWSYPEPSLIRIDNVPLFTGFMYSAVGSYLVRVWKIFNFDFTDFPSFFAASFLALMAYINFFTHHFLPDVRFFLFLYFFLLFYKTQVRFRIQKKERSMPLICGFFLVSFFLWIAENIGTFTHAWVYPEQQENWQWVSLQKISAWYLLMYLSFMMIYGFKKRPK